MRIDCPLCGSRDRREFTYLGEAAYLDRPDPEASHADWSDYLHMRDNPAGPRAELWYHEAGCTAWLTVTRNTTTHEITATALASSSAKAPE